MRHALLLTVVTIAVVSFLRAEPPPPASTSLPDDWRQTPVGSDGGLQYDPHGPGSFGVRIIPGVAGGMTEHVGQESRLPREARVRTINRRYDMECATEASAAPAPATSQPAAPTHLTVKRVGAGSVLNAWAAPKAPCDPAFADIAVGWNEPITYRIQADRSARYAVVFGLCEGHHTRAGQRPLELRLEGRLLQTVDPIAEQGRNVPVAYAFPISDENGDGEIEVAVAPVAGAADANAILNALWVFPADQLPPLDEVMAGRHNAAALAYVACGSGSAPSPHDDVLVLRLRSPEGLTITTVPTLTIESNQPIQVDADLKRVRIGTWTTVVCGAPFARADEYPGRTVLVYAPAKVPAGGERVLKFVVHRGAGDADVQTLLTDAAPPTGQK